MDVIADFDDGGIDGGCFVVIIENGAAAGLLNEHEMMNELYGVFESSFTNKCDDGLLNFIS